MEDKQIIDLLFERSEHAIDELNKKYGGVVRKTVANILQDRLDVEECVNDTYMAVWNNIPPQIPNPMISYICKTARNLAISRLRSETAVKRNSRFDLVLDELEEFIPSRMSIETDYELKETIASINRFLSTLNYDDRYILIRRYWYADPVKDIADIMGVRESCISTRLHRLRRKLRKNLKKEGYEI